MLGLCLDILNFLVGALFNTVYAEILEELNLIFASNLLSVDNLPFMKYNPQIFKAIIIHVMHTNPQWILCS